MKHINFVEARPGMNLKAGKFELNYFLMVLIALGLAALFGAIAVIQNRRIAGYEQTLQAEQQRMAKATAVMAPEAVQIMGIEWSKLLKRYTETFPPDIYLDSIVGSIKDGKKLVFQVIGMSPSDAIRAKRSLAQNGMCLKAKLLNVHEEENGVRFELECTL
ncbi:MAG: hypothetical protein V4534_06145 [Myxococcota bacterium]